jgi:gluconolactonase
MKTCCLLLSIAFAAAAADPVKLLDSGAGEGPAWHPEKGVFFTGGGKITQRDLSGKVSVYRNEAGGANGLLWDHQGRLVMCEAANRRITRIEKDGNLTILADRYNGKRFNSPNDLTTDSQGRIYFSDPRYGKRDNMELSEGVYRIDAPGQVVRVLEGGKDVDRPNGVLVSANGRYLYVADNNNNTPGGARKLWRFDLHKDGSVNQASRKLLFDWESSRGPDGLKEDTKGRLYVAGGINGRNAFESPEKFKGGVFVLNPNGKLERFIPIPVDEVTNVAFGGPHWKTLFITAGGTLWSLELETPGHAPFNHEAKR